MLLLAVVMPRPGGWTIDDGVKRIASAEGAGIWAERIVDGPVRSKLTDPGAFPPLSPPFAYRVPDGFALGFSPFTRAFAKFVGEDETLLRLVIAVSAILLWVFIERAGIRWAFLLLPLTFYALVPWEHVLSWLLLWPTTWKIATHTNDGHRSLAVAGALAAPAMLLRPETTLLVVVLAVFLAVHNYRWALTFAASATLILAALMVWHSATASEPLGVHLALNIEGRENAMAWLASRPATLSGLLLQMDRDTWMSIGMLAVFAAAMGMMMKGEVAKRRVWMAAGVVLLGTWTAWFQYRLWSYPVPPVALLGSNSLLATLPWVLVLIRPPYRGRPALWLAFTVVALTILLTPVWKGVHWGPRILLFAMPLLLLDLKQTNRARGLLFTVLLGVTTVQSVSSMALAYARNDEVRGRCRQLERELGSVVVCPGAAQCADLAPLWKGREFFTADTPRELKQLLIEFRRLNVDTCWLHLKGIDSLYASTFPEQKPVWPWRVIEIEAGSMYRTQWRVYALALSAGDTTWTGVLQAEAGTLTKEGRAELALEIQREAVELSSQSAQVHHNLALIYSALGEITEARAEVRRALEIDSTLNEARLLSADLSRRNGGTPAGQEPPPDRGQERPPD
jgi:hypothetical protein